jgi:diguanylate cyclase (GGDEF)-like protein/PAS domain S-box-containing protein
MSLSLTQKVSLALLIPALGAVVALWLFYSFLIQTASDSSFINVAGRQRMLSQQSFAYAQMIRSGHEENSPTLRELVDEFDRSLYALAQGGKVMGRTLPPAPPEVQDEIAEVQRLWPEQKRILLDIADQPAATASLHRDTHQLEGSTHRLTEASHRVVTAYEAWSQVLRSRIFHVLLTIAAFDVVLLFLGVRAARRYLAERRRTEEALRKGEKDWRLTFDSIPDLVSVHDRHFRIVRANKAMADFFGVPAAALVGRFCYEVFHGTEGPIANCPHARTLGTGKAETEEVNDPAIGCPMLITTSPVLDENGEVLASVHVAKDITELKRTENRLHHLAHYDHLTRLPNRTLFLDRLNQMLARSHWHKRCVAVLFLDLDRFKVINDTLGHDIGDLLLQAVAERLGGTVRDGDTVARFGGDEFIIALMDVAEEHHVRDIAEKILHALARPYEINGRELFVTASIGISLYPDHGSDAGSLVRNADASMYRAKEHGKNNYQFYSPSLHAYAPRRLTLETDLRHALERQELLLHYQPMVNLATGKVSGAEALLRWRHPEFGVISPMEFIPLLEETGLIIPVGAWVLETACAQQRAWQEAGFPSLYISVNLSARQFKQPDLTETIATAVQKTGLDPRHLALELTETILVEHTETTLASLRTLSGMGISLAIDDFGTGYSSLSYLKRFPIDALKIDRSFVRDITTDADDAAIAQAIVAMGHSLGLSVVAEGVETREQLDFLCQYRCDEMQGYYFSHPLPADAFSLLLKEERRLQECRPDKPNCRPAAIPISTQRRR